MSYTTCGAQCWTRLIKSPIVFYKRIVSQFVYNVKKCWSETYKHCTKNCHCWICWCRLKSIFCIVWQTIVNIFCTVWTVVETVISIDFYVIWFVLAIVRCIFLPCPIGKHKAPVINTCDELFRNLRTTVNDELTWYDKFLGMVFTSAKETGFSNAWDEYDLWIEARGIVIHDAYSTDGLETIDISLTSLAAYDHETHDGEAKCSWTEIEGKFIRVEVFPEVLVFYSGPQPQPGNHILVKGRLYWDRDGFLEIHPQHGGDLRILP
jgi:hypothetical protein